MVQVAGTDRMGIEVDASEVDDPGQLGGVAHHDLFRRPARWKRQLYGLDPLRTRCGSALLKEGLTFSAVDETLERHRATVNTTQRALRHGHVIADQVKLCVAGLGKEDFVRIADGDLPTGDLEDFLLRSGHVDTIPGTSLRSVELLRRGPGAWEHASAVRSSPEPDKGNQPDHRYHDIADDAVDRVEGTVEHRHEKE